MKGRKLAALIGMTAIVVAAGCNATEEKQKEVTKVPVAEVTNPPVSMTPVADEEQSYGVSFSEKEETEEVADGDFVYFKSSIYYPVFEGDYADDMNRFVESLTERFRDSLPEASENAKYDYEDSLTSEYIPSIFPEEEELTISCLWDRDQYVTLFVQGISSTGGVHPNVYCQAYVVNLANGCPESLEQMLKPYGLTTEELVEYATEKIRVEHGEELYDYDDKNDLKKDVNRFLQENQWYFDENGLVVFANPYEIAAYACGMIKCEISYEELEQGLKK